MLTQTDRFHIVDSVLIIMFNSRQNPRNFTAVNNHGVTHREYLAYPGDAGDINYNNMSVDLATSLARAAAMEGPTQYYNTLCRNNPEALKTLLSNKRFGWPTNQYTGFHVRLVWQGCA